MKWSLIFFVLACVACKDDKPAQSSYIKPDVNEVIADVAGVRIKIAVSSNCNWQIGETPQWCSAQKITQDHKEFLDLEVAPNDAETSRETVIRLSYESTVSTLHIFQDGKTDPTDPLRWSPFPVNSLTEAEYELSGDGITRNYRITGDKVFVTPSFGKQVYPGHLIHRRSDYRTLTAYDQYTYNPIRFTAFVNNKLYENESRPSFDAVHEMAERIIAELPEQNFRFYLSSPIQYHSYRHLHLLGFGNLGLNLDESVGGKPYTQKQMSKRTGLIYSYALELFHVIMDVPEKLIVETPDERELPDMSYINGITYGKTALLLIESDYDFKTLKSVVAKIAGAEDLSGEDLKIRDDLDCWYVYFDRYGVHLTKGNYSLIERSLDEINTSPTAIIPLNFTTNKLENNSVGTMEIGLELQQGFSTKYEPL